MDDKPHMLEGARPARRAQMAQMGLNALARPSYSYHKSGFEL